MRSTRRRRRRSAPRPTTTTPSSSGRTEPGRRASSVSSRWSEKIARTAPKRIVKDAEAFLDAMRRRAAGDLSVVDDPKVKTAVDNVTPLREPGLQRVQARQRDLGRTPSAAAAVRGLAADLVLVEPLREVQPLEHELDRGRHAGRRLPHLEVGERVASTRAGPTATTRTRPPGRRRRCARRAPRRTRSRAW